MATNTRTQAHIGRYVGGCPECGGRIDESDDEEYCRNCGLITAEDWIDRGPDWQWAFDDETDPSRAKPGDRNLVDRGLGSEIGGDSRLQTWHSRCRVDSKHQRNQGYATTEVRRMAVRLELPDADSNYGRYLFRQYHDAGEVVGQDLDTVAAAALLAACRIRQRGVTASDIEPVARDAEERQIARRYRELAAELNLEVPPPSLVARARRVVGDLPIDSKAQERVCERVRSIDDEAAIGTSPTTLVAFAAYDVTGLTQTQVADALGTCAVSIRNVRKRLQAD